MQAFRTYSYENVRFQDPILVLAPTSIGNSVATGVKGFLWTADATCTILEYGAIYTQASSATIGTLGRLHLQKVTTAGTITTVGTITAAVSKKLGANVVATMTAFTLNKGQSLRLASRRQGEGGKTGKFRAYIQYRHVVPTA